MAFQSSAGTFATDPTSGVTHAHTQLAGSDRVCSCAVQWETESSTTSTVGSITYGGTSILSNSSGKATGTDGGSNATYGEIFYALEALMAALGDGVRNVVAAIAAGGSRQGLSVYVTQFSGRAQAVPSGAKHGAANANTVGITPDAGDDLIGIWTTNTSGTDISPPGGWTERWDSGGLSGDTRNGGATQDAAAGGSTTFTASGSASRPCVVADALAAAAAGGSANAAYYRLQQLAAA